MDNTAGKPDLPGRFIKLEEVMQRVALSRTTILRWEAEGRFPKRADLGPRCLRWADTDINVWMASRSAGAHAAAQPADQAA